MPVYDSTSGFPLYDAATGRPLATPCCYRQSRRCSDNALSGLWLREDLVPASLAIKQGTTCYTFSLSDPVATCAGTLHSGWTVAAGCADCSSPGPDCASYCAPGTPRANGILSLSGITICTTCQDSGGSSGSNLVTGSIDGDYLLGASGACEWRGTYTVGAIWKHWTTNFCAGTVASTSSTLTCFVSMNVSGTFNISVQLSTASMLGAFAILAGNYDCRLPVGPRANQLTSCNSAQLGHGGTALWSPQ